MSVAASGIDLLVSSSSDGVDHHVNIDTAFVGNAIAAADLPFAEGLVPAAAEEVLLAVPLHSRQGIDYSVVAWTVLEIKYYYYYIII